MKPSWRRSKVTVNYFPPGGTDYLRLWTDAVIEIAGLGFLGLGVQPPDAEWGTMISLAYRSILNAPHLVLFPGIMIFLNVLAFNLLGDALRDALDPLSERRA